MKIVDYKSVKVESSSDFITDTIGIVVKSQEETGFNTLGLYIPRIMMGMDIKGGKKETVMSVGYTKIKNSKKKQIGKATANWQNYIEVPCLQIPNVQLPKYNIGERVYVTFADQDINSVAFLPFSVADVKKRPTDIVDFGVSARKDDKEELSDKNTYRLRFDSTNQLIQLYMTKANGEISTYSFTIDGKNGKVIIGDEKRFISLFTEDDMIQIENEAGSIWQMKEGVVTLTCEEYNVMASKKIHMETETLEIVCDDFTNTVSNSITEESSKKKVTSKQLEENIDASKYKGTKSEREMKMDVNNSDVVSITKFLGAADIAWMAPSGMKGLPTSPTIAKSGAANFANPSQMGRPLAVAQPTTTLLSFLGVQVDILFGCLGCPPAASSMINANAPLLTSQFVKG